MVTSVTGVERSVLRGFLKRLPHSPDLWDCLVTYREQPDEDRLDRVIHTWEGAASAVPESPPIAKGRRVEGEPEMPLPDIWLRREFVPCGNKRCKLPEDLHGPYWYSYRKSGDRWVPTYHGKPKPVLREPYTPESALELVTRLEGAHPISDGDMDGLRNAIVDLQEASPATAEPIQTRAEDLFRREEARRETVLRTRHRDLLRKARKQSLTDAERDELNTASILLSDH